MTLRVRGDFPELRAPAGNHAKLKLPAKRRAWTDSRGASDPCRAKGRKMWNWFQEMGHTVNSPCHVALPTLFCIPEDLSLVVFAPSSN